MPYTGYRPHDQQIDYRARKSPAAAAKREVDVTLEPVAQSDVPAPPEFRHTVAHIGVVEVLRECEPHHLAQTYRHVGIAAEIEVDLERECQYSKPGCDRRQAAVVQSLDLSPQQTDVVCDEHFLAKSHDETGDSVADHLFGDGALVYLVLDILVSYDRSCDYLGEQRDERHEACRVLLHLDIPAIEINGVAHRLEREEADSYRQRKVRIRYSQPEPGIQRFYDESQVLKRTQQTYVHYQRHQQANRPDFRTVVVFVDDPPGGVVYERREYHDKDVNRLAPGIEQKSADENHHVLCLFWHEVI